METSWAPFLLALFFLTIVSLHIVRKNMSVAIIYGIQSFAIVLLFVQAALTTEFISSIGIAILIFIVKVVFVPLFIIQLINKHKLTFLVSTYVSLPLTFIIVAALTAMAHASLFLHLVQHIPAHQSLLSLALSALLVSFFLIVNRKGATSQIIGILSLENSIVAFAFFAGLEQSPILQLGILFDIFVWLIIATVFISMLHKHFGSLNVTEMKELQD